MSRSAEQRLGDVLDCCKRILRQTAGMTRDEFFTHAFAYDAAVKNFLVLGEAVKGIPLDVRTQMPAVPWRELAGLRDILIHIYFKVNEDIVWHAIQDDIPMIHDTIERYLYGPTLFE